MGVVALEVIGGELGCGGVPNGVVDGLVLMGEVPWEVIGGVLGCVVFLVVVLVDLFLWMQ